MTSPFANRRPLIVAALIACSPCTPSAQADEPGGQPVEQLLRQASAAETVLESARLRQAKIEARHAQMQATLFEPRQIEIRSTGELRIVQDHIANNTKALAAAREALDVATSEIASAADSGSHPQELRLRHAEARKAHFTLQLTIADLRRNEAVLQRRIEQVKTEQAVIAENLKHVVAELEQASTEIAELEADYVDRQRRAQASLKTLGRFVSFSSEVAPIFAERCLACHNARSAGGRLNMDSFASLARGGESGAVIEARAAENSLLWTMVDDGLMPKDADPLTAPEVAILKKWIDVGAPLDAGVDAKAELFRVIPEVDQPLPPKDYRVPIPVTALAFSPDGSLLASSGYHEVLLFSTDDGSLSRRIANVAERVYAVDFNRDGTEIAVAAGTPGKFGDVKIFSVTDGSHRRTLVRAKDALFSVRYSPDGMQLAAGGADRTISIVSVATGSTVHRIEDHADWVLDLNWSSDGRQLVTASRDRTSKVFDAASGQLIITFNGHEDCVNSAAFLPDGATVVSVGSDRQARVWTTADAKETRSIGGFGDDIFRIVVTPANHLLSGCADGHVREHSLADGAIVREYPGHHDWIYALAWNPSHGRIASGSYDGRIRVSNTADGSAFSSFMALPQVTAKD